MRPLIAITMGDITGIGPEVVLKALASMPEDNFRYLILGDESRARHLNDSLRLGLDIHAVTDAVAAKRICVLSPALTAGAVALPPALSPGAPEAARAALDWLREGAGRCLRREAAALVTGPVSKEAIIRAGYSGFLGQTEFLSQFAGVSRTVMMLLGPDDRNRWLRVALATTHVPLKDVARQLTQEKVELAIERAAQACQDLGLRSARVGVCGLNPHAGEGGHLGDEEQRVISPAVAAARRRGLSVIGPLAADTLFHHALRGDYEAVVAMYHDQGLAPLKMVAFDQGVNWTLGLPFIRTSPDHGTAYDIAGQGVANPSSTIAALQLARRLVQGASKC